MERIKKVVEILKSHQVEVLGTMEVFVNGCGDRTDVLTKSMCIGYSDVAAVGEYAHEQGMGMSISTHSIEGEMIPRIKFMFVYDIKH